MRSQTFGVGGWLGLALVVLIGCAPLATPEPLLSVSPTAPDPSATAPPIVPSATANPATSTAPAPATPEPPGWITERCVLPTAVSVSPTGAWAATDCQDTAAQLLVGTGAEVAWIIGGEPLSARQVLRRRPLLWSADGRHLYYAQTAERSGDSAHGFAQVGSVYRLTLATGDRVEILRSVNDLAVFSVAVDAAGSRLAWLPADAPERVTVIDLRTYLPQKIPLGSALATGGDLTWSPSGDRLLMSAVQPDGRGTLIMIEPATETVVALATPADRIMRVLAWPPGEVLALRDEDWPAPSAWTLQLSTGEFLRQIAGDPP